MTKNEIKLHTKELYESVILVFKDEATVDLAIYENLFDDDYMKVFGDNLIQQYAQNATESGQIGLAKQLYDAMVTSRNGIQPNLGSSGKEK